VDFITHDMLILVAVMMVLLEPHAMVSVERIAEVTL